MKTFLLALLVCLPAIAQPRVLVIGDSVSIGYTPHLGFPAEHNPGNAQWSAYTLEHLGEWLNGEYDAIVYNNGLHDIAHSKPNGEIRATLAEYTENVTAIMDELLLHTRCLVVPNITMVPESYPQDYRSNADAVLYGQELRRIATKKGAMVVNLYAATLAHPEWYPHADVHPVMGYNTLGQVVGDAVLQAMDPESVPVLSSAGVLVLMLAFAGLYGTMTYIPTHQ